MGYNSEHFQKFEKRLEKARFSKDSYMSNSKWEKLFKAVANSEISLCDGSIKNLTDEYIRPFNLKSDGLYCVRYSTADKCGGPVYYKEIEWIFIPAFHEIERRNREEKLVPQIQTNDIYALKELIDALGKFEYDFNENGLKIYGYK